MTYKLLLGGILWCLLYCLAACPHTWCFSLLYVVQECSCTLFFTLCAVPKCHGSDGSCTWSGDCGGASRLLGRWLHNNLAVICGRGKYQEWFAWIFSLHPFIQVKGILSGKNNTKPGRKHSHSLFLLPIMPTFSSLLHTWSLAALKRPLCSSFKLHHHCLRSRSWSSTQCPQCPCYHLQVRSALAQRTDFSKDAIKALPLHWNVVCNTYKPNNVKGLLLVTKCWAAALHESAAWCCLSVDKQLQHRHLKAMGSCMWTYLFYPDPCSQEFLLFGVHVSSATHSWLVAFRVATAHGLAKCLALAILTDCFWEQILWWDTTSQYNKMI